MTSKFEAEIDRALAQWRRDHSGELLRMHVFRTRDIPHMLKQADAGNQLCRGLLATFRDWTKNAERALAVGMRLACGCCSSEVVKGNVHGFAVISPKTNEHTIGMSMVLCAACTRGTQQQVADRIFTALESEGFREITVH